MSGERKTVGPAVGDEVGTVGDDVAGDAVGADVVGCVGAVGNGVALLHVNSLGSRPLATRARFSRMKTGTASRRYAVTATAASVLSLTNSPASLTLVAASPVHARSLSVRDASPTLGENANDGELPADRACAHTDAHAAHAVAASATTSGRGHRHRPPRGGGGGGGGGAAAPAAAAAAGEAVDADAGRDMAMSKPKPKPKPWRAPRRGSRVDEAEERHRRHRGDGVK